MNNGENKNELNAISLGNVENVNENLNVPVGDIPPVVPLEPIESLDTLNESVTNSNVSEKNNLNPSLMQSTISNNAQSNVLLDNNINSVPPVQPIQPESTIQYDIPEPINNFNTTPVFNEIGTVPPIPNGPVNEPTFNNGDKKKRKMNKTIFVLIIILALTAVGVAVYIFLHLASNKTYVRTKNVDLEIGSTVSTNILDYATFSNVDSNTCSLDTTAISDTNTLNAEYTYKIVCGTNSYTGKVKIVDTVKPEVKLKDVTIAVNGSITPESFILECKDSTKCSYVFKEEEKVKEYLKTPESYRVGIIVTDEAGNETEVTGTLTVSDTVSSVYLICTKQDSNYTEMLRLGLINSEFSKVATRVYTFKFATKDEYTTFKNENSDKVEVTYQNITGSPEFNDENLTLSISKILTYDELNSEAGSTVPISTGDLKSFYQEKGYTCSIGF